MSMFLNWVPPCCVSRLCNPHPPGGYIPPLRYDSAETEVYTSKYKESSGVHGRREQIIAHGRTDRSRLRAEPGGVRVTAGEAVADGRRPMCMHN